MRDSVALAGEDELRSLVASEQISGDQGLLTRARNDWYVGDWRALLQLDPQEIERNPCRDRLALIVACANQYSSDHALARTWVQRALAWGCPQRLAAKLMLSGLHNTMGRIAALRDDNAGVTSHFDRAISIVGEAQFPSASVTRAARELAAVGLLPQAAGMVQSEIDRIDLAGTPPAELDARLTILQTSIELLHHELSLAHQRNQLSGPETRHVEQAHDAFVQELRHRSPSQLGQDLWVLERSAYKRGGFFVEFGATDGVVLSNTLLLEREFGWNGICAEPNPTFFGALKANRRCITSSACIGARSGDEVEFIYADVYGGMQAHAQSDSHANKRAAYRAGGHTARLTTVSLHDFLLSQHASREIDYLSIDTEGSELDILRSFPFDAWNVRLITVEHNFTSARAQIRQLLARHGYCCTEASHDDYYEKTN